MENYEANNLTKMASFGVTQSVDLVMTQYTTSKKIALYLLIFTLFVS